MTLVTEWCHWENDGVEMWAQSTRAAVTAGTVVSLGPLWESCVARAVRRAGWVLVLTRDKDPTAGSAAGLL